jgi:iron complex outermembrane receptor protein
MTRKTASKPPCHTRGTPPFPLKARALALTASAFCAGPLLFALPQALRAAPNENTLPATFDFAIPAGPLSGALLQFSEISGKRVLFHADLVRGLNSRGLHGRYSANQALQKLLSGSGLKAKNTESGSMTLENTPHSSSALGESTLGAVTVTGKAEYDSTDPYNSDYSLPNASTATKTDTPIMETPMSIKVVPQQVLKDQQAITLDQALRNVSGVVAGAGINRQFYLRGFEVYNYYRDGYPFKFNWFHTEELANIDRVEVLKGPGSILYGRAEPGGIINFVTKQPLDTPYYSLRQQFGSYDYYRTDIDATGPLTADKNLAYRLNFAYQTNNSITEFAGNERIFVAPMLRWNISENTTSTIKLEYSDIKNKADNPILLNGNGTQQGFTTRKQNLNDPWAFTEDEYVMLSLNTEHRFNDDWKLRHRFNASFAQETQRNITASGTVAANGDVDRFFFESNADGNDYFNNFYNSLELTGKFATGFAKHTLLVGGDYMVSDAKATMGPVFGLGGTNIYNPFHYAQVPSIPSYNTFTYHQPWFGVYAQDQVELPYHVHLLGGLRYDNARTGGTSEFAVFGGSPSVKPTVTDDRVSPRGGILWQPLPELSLYGSYSENFGASNAPSTTNGARLPPQIGQQWEGGVKTELFDGRFSTTLAYYDLKKQNMPMQECQGCPSRAIGEAETRGLELDVSGELLPGWKLIGAYTYMPFAKTLKDTAAAGTLGKRLHNTPVNSGNLWMTYNFQQASLQGLKLGAGMQAVGPRPVGYNEAIRAPGYVTINLMAGHTWNFGKTHVTAQLNADNLLDKTYLGGLYSYGMGLYGAPRTFMGSIRLEY